MPSIYFLALSWLCSRACVTALVTSPIALQVPPRFEATDALDVLHCRFTVETYVYDFCHLFSSDERTIFTIKDTPPTKTTSTFTLSFTGPLVSDMTLPDELKCPDGTWMCLIVSNDWPTHPSVPPRITQVIPIAGNFNSELVLRPTVKLETNFTDTFKPLRLTLRGGMYKEEKQKAVFQFHCNENAEEPSSPKFLPQWNDKTHFFTWTSKYACPKVLSIPAKEPQETNPPDDESDLPPIEEGDGIAPGQVPSSSLPFFYWLSFLCILSYTFFVSRRRGLKSQFRIWAVNARMLFLQVRYWKWKQDDANDEQYVVVYDQDDEVPLTPISGFGKSAYGTNS